MPTGAVAPDVTETASVGSSTTLSTARGHAAVVYFYPKDETPGCTKEACAFRDGGSIASAYGVSSTLGVTSRVTFLVGTYGTIVRDWPDVDPGVHADEVLAAAEAAQLLPAAATKSVQ